LKTFFFVIFYSQFHKHIVLKSIIKYETTQNKIKICEKLQKLIKYGHLKVNFIV